MKNLLKFIVFVMSCLGLYSIWFDAEIAKPMASLAVILVSLVTVHLVSWLFKK